MSKSTKYQEIERKFLVSKIPRMLAKYDRKHIRQGYLLHEGGREARIRSIGGDFFLTIKEGEGLQRTEVEMAISKAHFEALWPLTAGRRLEKKRYRIPEGKLILEVDVFSGELAPLCLAEVEFVSVKASRNFEKPDFFGDEVTFDLCYGNAFLAAHGTSRLASCDYRIGAMPYKIVDGRLHIMIITARSGKRWGIPKGQPEVDMTKREVALMEVFEEAGIVGDLRSEFTSRCLLRDERMLTLFPLKIALIEGNWPEMKVRKRELLPADEAIARISDPQLAECMRQLCKKLVVSVQ